jgi:hypothetical protein
VDISSWDLNSYCLNELNTISFEMIVSFILS